MLGPTLVKNSFAVVAVAAAVALQLLGARAFWVLETQKTTVASYYYTSILLQKLHTTTILASYYKSCILLLY